MEYDNMITFKNVDVDGTTLVKHYFMCQLSVN